MPRLIFYPRAFSDCADAFLNTFQIVLPEPAVFEKLILDRDAEKNGNRIQQKLQAGMFL